MEFLSLYSQIRKHGNALKPSFCVSTHMERGKEYSRKKKGELEKEKLIKNQKRKKIEKLKNQRKTANKPRDL